MFICCEAKIQLLSSAGGYPVVRVPFVKETTLSPLNDLGTLSENQLGIDVWVYFWTINSISLIYMPIMPVPHCFDYCSLVISFKINKFETSSFIFIFQDCFSYSGSLGIPNEF